MCPKWLIKAYRRHSVDIPVHTYTHTHTHTQTHARTRDHTDISPQHPCFLGAGAVDQDPHVGMVVSHFLQRRQKYVSVAHGGFEGASGLRARARACVCVCVLVMALHPPLVFREGCS